MGKGNLKELYGTVTIDPDTDVIAGSYGTWRITYTVGSEGIATGGHIRLHTDSDTDWAIPQFGDAAAADYATLQAPQGSSVAIVTQGYRGMLLTVLGRGLRQGEQVVLTLGDRSGGGRGSRAQTFLEAERFFLVSVAPMADDKYVDLPDPPQVRIIGGPAESLVVVAPSTVVMEEPFRLLVKAEDRWGNPSSLYRGTVEIAASATSVPTPDHTFTAKERGVYWLEGCRCTDPGLHTISVRDTKAALVAQSNPILCEAKKGEYTLYWGDPHGGQLSSAAKIPSFFAFARDSAGIDFAGYQANDHRLSTEEWRLQQQAENDFYEPGRFVPLPGTEWSGETSEGGHHNVYFRRHNQPIRRSAHHANIAKQADHDTDLTHVLELHQAYRYSDVVITPHVGGGRADLDFHEPNLEPAIEVTSTHGTFEWFLEEALRHGYKLGFIGGSDGYTGRPGAEYPGHQERRYAKGGYAALYAEELTVASILEALKARRGYGTTGARILLRVDGDGHMMGEENHTRLAPTITARVAGTAPLESVELYRGLDLLYRHPLQSAPSSNRVRILWEGASRRTSYSGVIWDGRLDVEGAKISLGSKIRFDSPRSYLHDLTESGLGWHSVTCGYGSGVTLDVSGGEDVVFSLALSISLITTQGFGGFGDVGPNRISYTPTETLSLRFAMKDLLAGPKTLEIGPFRRRLTASLAPSSGVTSAEFTFVDREPNPGINPYWLRVVQTDMEMAWSSPLFVDYVAPDA